jgi:NTE family protein
MKKTALILSGGGFKCSYEVGALNLIAENWTAITGKSGQMKFDLVAGVSAGVFNGGMVAMDKLSELNEFWNLLAKNGGKEIFESDIIDNRGNFSPDTEKLARFLPDTWFCVKALFKSVFGMITGKGFKKSLLNEVIREIENNVAEIRSLGTHEPLRQKIEHYFSKDSFPEDTRFLCGFVSLEDARYHLVEAQNFDTDTDLAEAVLASLSLPVLSAPVPEVGFNHKKVKNLMDGGIQNISPVGSVLEYIRSDTESDYELFIINCNNTRMENYGNEKLNIATISLKALNDFLMSEIFRNDMKTFLLINELAKQAAPGELVIKGKKLRNFKFHYVHPEAEDREDSFNLSMEVILDRKARGYADATRVFKPFL